MYEVRYTKGGEKDRMKLMRSPYAEIATAILEQLKLDPYSNTGGGLEKVYDGDIFYVRRISAKHRLVYQIDEDARIILIWEMWNHYDRMGQKKRKR
ncbi:MAG: type II toxin-antitoxin system YoeB family toxin [Bacteroidales bacterium]|nr:type II toxin-antitoxin system YoeB family toxin [Bacteroidales bacterium]